MGSMRTWGLASTLAGTSADASIKIPSLSMLCLR
jgi:hypothetical protein